MDAGLDSLSGVELKSQLETEFGVELPETVVFDYPTGKDAVAVIHLRLILQMMCVKYMGQYFIRCRALHLSVTT